MSRSLPTNRSALLAGIPSILILGVAASCGHSQATWDAYNSAKNGSAIGGAGAPPAGTAGGSNATAGGPPSGDQFSCTAVASQQFDPLYMKAYPVQPEVEEEVSAILKVMTPREKASQMIGIPVGNPPDYLDIERSPDVTVNGTTIRGYNYRDAGRGVNLDAGQKNRASDGKDYATVFPA